MQASGVAQSVKQTASRRYQEAAGVPANLEEEARAMHVLSADHSHSRLTALTDSPGSERLKIEPGGSRRTLLLTLAKDASLKGWWEEYADFISSDYAQFIGLEHEAGSMAIWHVEVVAGLLQTEAYARHIISSYNQVEPIAPGMVEQLVRVRLLRQRVLARTPPLQLSVVLDESVLRCRIGDDMVMYEQLRRLAQEADRPNVMLHILPLNAQHTVFGESFAIFRFGPDNDAILQDVVSAEHLKNAFQVEGERETYLHRIAFQMIVGASLDPVASRALILYAAESYWSDAQRVR